MIRRYRVRWAHFFFGLIAFGVLAGLAIGGGERSGGTARTATPGVDGMVGGVSDERVALGHGLGAVSGQTRRAGCSGSGIYFIPDPSGIYKVNNSSEVFTICNGGNVAYIYGGGSIFQRDPDGINTGPLTNNSFYTLPAGDVTKRFYFRNTAITEGRRYRGRTSFDI